ncbi:Probable peptidase [Mycobacteroides abscessus subsp. bolletii]|nr:Probable peptidase [Mycobacteroides abscessus subsp. bolletii]SLD80074.1 Probable peptidase [Mycobacteroides abscessus subsp. bolletii]SLD86959.1 Probable peptidase [Mycobacteroides abscessus subsp. bolletii]
MTACGDPARRLSSPPSFLEIYRELVETNTTNDRGDCTAAAQKVADALKTAGYPDDDVVRFVDERYPKAGGLVAVLHGTDPSLKAIDLLAAIDVVEADPAQWRHDPFKLTEENGFYYGRGVIDDKSMAAIFTDSMIRYHQEKFVSKRSLKLILTCGEENGVFNGAQYLAEERRDLIDAAFAINEGADGQLDEKGHLVALQVTAGDKLYRDFTLQTTGPSGHSSRPLKDNSIDRLSEALLRIRHLEFPTQVSEVAKAYFQEMAKTQQGEIADDMRNPSDAAAANRLSEANPTWRALLHTTCVATTVKGGEATNALPPVATANVNCRILPGTQPEQVRNSLVTAVADPNVTITEAPKNGAGSIPAPPLPITQQILAPVQQTAAKIWPGTPVIPTINIASTDGSTFTAAGIPTYSIPRVLRDPDGDGVHGIDEHVRVDRLSQSRDFLYQTIKLYVNEP